MIAFWKEARGWIVDDIFESIRKTIIDALKGVYEIIKDIISTLVGMLEMSVQILVYLFEKVGSTFTYYETIDFGGSNAARYVVINEISRNVSPKLKHNDTMSQIEHVFRRYGFYTTKEYLIYKIKDGSGRAGRIDLVAREGKFRVAVEYDHHGLIKWKSLQKIVQIRPDVAIGITGLGSLEPNIERAGKYAKNLKPTMYIVSLRERKYHKFDKLI